MLPSSPSGFLSPERAPERAAVARGASLRRRIVPLLGAALALTSLWAGGASYYLIFHDEMLARFVASQSAMQSAYERRLSALQLQLDLTVSDHTASRGSMESRLGAIAERQALIEKRHGQLSGLAGAVPEAAIPASSLAPPVEAPPSGEAPTRLQKPFPTPDTPELRMRGADRAVLPVRLRQVEQRLDRLAEGQARAVGALARQAGHNAGRYRDLLLQAGLDPARFDKASTPPRGIGGPLVPLGADAFEQGLAEVRAQVDEETRLRRIAGALPFRRPLPGSAVQTSSFGARVDPFTHGMALHTGIDLRADSGVPARATAAGRVMAAEYAGGYGNMVEVDHGHGIATRYAHLSGFSVAPGQRVEAGAIVGRVGSTGRSTGSHLHYETRVDGEPVDPQRFLRAGAQLVFTD